MSLSINLPENTVIPNEISSFTPDDNLLMILIGSKTVHMIKNNYLAGNMSEEISKIRTEYTILLNSKDDENRLIRKIYDDLLVVDKAKLEIDNKDQIQIEKNQLKLYYGDIINKYSNDIESHSKTIENLNKEIFVYKDELSKLEKENIKKEETFKHYQIISDLKIENEVNNKLKNKEDTIKKEIDGYKEKLNSLTIQIEKDKNERLMDTIDVNNKSIKDITLLLDNLKSQSTIVNKSNARGYSGENYFMNLALNTFCDCSNFEIVDKAKTPHSGDFWLKFDKFTIMVDSKNYVDTPVPSRDRQKLKNDVSYNQHIKIAWLVSMDQPILTYSNYPFMIDIDDGVCYCYINSLMKSENPANLLRMAWYASNFVHENLLNVDSENNMLEKYQKNEIRVKGILNKMLVQSKERFATLNQLTENFKAADADIRDCLNEEIRDVRTQHIEVIESWWNSNLIKQEGHKLKSTEIHKKFISYEENRRHGIDVDMFKQILRSIPSLKSEEIVRGKTDKAMYVIVGYKFL
jgi:hypothetical protein